MKLNKKEKLILVIILVLIITIITITKKTNIKKDIYIPESRIQNIKQEQQKDKEQYKTIAWLQVQGTKIDTPVISYDNIDYLKNIDKENYLWNNICKE